MIAEYDGGGQMTRRYVHGPGVDQPLVWYEGGTTSDRRFLLADERGSIAAVTNASGALIGTNRYDEYGIPAAANIGRFQYTGQTWLPEIGLYYYKARMYSPTLGRFMQTDPIGYADGLNWYNYVGGDPVNKVDPTGTTWVAFQDQQTWIPDDQLPVLVGGSVRCNASCQDAGNSLKATWLFEEISRQRSDFYSGRASNIGVGIRPCNTLDSAAYVLDFASGAATGAQLLLGGAAFGTASVGMLPASASLGFAAALANGASVAFSAISGVVKYSNGDYEGAAISLSTATLSLTGARALTALGRAEKIYANLDKVNLSVSGVSTVLGGAPKLSCGGF